jgi:hypothetical protein
MTCPHCGETFTPSRGNARYCSPRCQKAASEQRNRARYRERNRARIRERQRDWYFAHLERNRARSRERTRDYYRAHQEQTREEATHHGEPWGGYEIELACDRSVTAQEAALLLGRTLGAVERIRNRMRHAVTGPDPPPARARYGSG